MSAHVCPNYGNNDLLVHLGSLSLSLPRCRHQRAYKAQTEEFMMLVAMASGDELHLEIVHCGQTDL